MDPEYKALTSVFSAHKSYKSWAVKQVVAPKKLKYKSLTKDEQALFPWMDQHIDYLEHSVNLNAQFLEQIAMTVAPMWGAEPDPGVWAECSAQDLDKVRSILIQFAREWSAECADERAASFGRILQECENLFPDVVNRQNVEILVPGSGLGRLVVEFVRRGFRTQGNEFSYHMLTNSSFIVNHSFCENNYVICPYLHKSSNVSKRTDQIRQVYIPDFNPGDISFINKEYPEIPVADLMSMVAGSPLSFASRTQNGFKWLQHVFSSTLPRTLSNICEPCTIVWPTMAIGSTLALSCGITRTTRLSP
ncbi:hypothetical protein KL909_003860 [Ogataea angusta]|nr:hypothetical protein KL909_003860 [Ogataea angusta]